MEQEVSLLQAAVIRWALYSSLILSYANVQQDYPAGLCRAVFYGWKLLHSSECDTMSHSQIWVWHQFGNRQEGFKPN